MVKLTVSPEQRHSCISSAPSTIVVEPEGQRRQYVKPVEFWYEPSAHNEQALLPSSEYVPSLHSRKEVAPGRGQ